MDHTDRHDRYFLRLISPNSLLYTEMITTGALINGDAKYLLDYDKTEHPIALQLGGNEPDKLELCAKLAEQFQYDEINLNVGCPSDRVKSAKFGACLMLEPNLVSECVSAMANATNIPVTVKCRIGVDNQDSYEQLCNFISIVSKSNCNTFIIHARKAWLNGLSPKQNREIPPLCYNTVRSIKRDFPNLSIIINGGIKTAEEIIEHLTFVDGVMIGREAYSNPYLLSSIEKIFFTEENLLTRHEVMEKFIAYIEQQLKNSVKLSSMTRHILGLFHGEPGARMWRRYLSENVCRQGAGISIIYEALQYV